VPSGPRSMSHMSVAPRAGRHRGLGQGASVARKLLFHLAYEGLVQAWFFRARRDCGELGTANLTGDGRLTEPPARKAPTPWAGLP
jgi:hypothetical protein